MSAALQTRHPAVLRARLGAGVLLLAVGFVIGRFAAPVSAPASPSPTRPIGSLAQSKPGPWGRLEYIPIKIEPPKELLPKLARGPAHWFFEGHTAEQVAQLMEHSGVTPETVNSLRANAALWETTPAGTFLSPPTAFVMNLPAIARTAIYAVLARSNRNQAQRSPFPVSPELVESLTTAGLSDSTITQFRSLLYGSGPWHLFADLSTELSVIAGEEEGTRFARAILRADSLVVRLRVDDTTDLDSVLRYWDPARRNTAERPLLEAFTRVSGGGDINVLAFLSVMPRRYVNRYPNPFDPVEAHADCFWSSLNFGTDHVDHHVDDPLYVLSTFRSGYQPTGKPPTLGDLIVLLDDRGTPVHAAVYLADDLVFTKNGYGILHPWTLMSRLKMIDLYTSLLGRIHPVVVAPTDAKIAPAAVSAATFR